MHTIIERHDGDRTLYILDDGYDYPGVLDAYRKGEIVGTPLSGGMAKRQATRLDHDGRQFLLKTDTREYRHWDSRLKLRLYGLPFLPTMRKVVKAIDAGFDRIQQMYMIEQTVVRNPQTGAVAVTAWLLIEYLPGELLQESSEFSTYLPQIPALLNELHTYKLVQSDPNGRNFVLAGGVLKVIDLHFFSNPFITVWPRGVMKVVDGWGIAFPLDSFFDRMVYRVARGKVRLLKFIHGLSKKKKRGRDSGE